MKKVILLIVLMGISEITFGQSFEKGNLLGFHVLTIELDPDVTFNQFKDFYNDKVIPELNKYFPDTKTYLVFGTGGANKNSLGMITVFESEEVKDRYYNKDGSRTELGKSAWEKVDPVRNELYKLGAVDAKYTDWVIQ
jgi:hypothetical protein